MKPAARTLLICAGLAACCAAIYAQTLWHGFVSYDDGLYVYDNPHVKAGLTWNGLWWAVTTQRAMYPHPVTWLSHMLDCQMYGLKPWGHHLTSLLLHALNAVLLFLVLARMTRRVWPGALVAALFAVHPLHVESVAWVAERKDLVSTLCWTAALGAHAWYRNRPGAVRYLGVVLLFVLGLLSKPMVVTLPFVLLLLDYWPLERVNRDQPVRGIARGMLRLAVEKIPLFAVSAAFCVVTLVMQSGGNNLDFGRRVPVTARFANAAVVYVLYLVKTVWPANLAVYYPHPIHRPVWQVAGAVLVLAAVTVLCLRQMRRRPWLIVGWLWYLGTLVPVIELVQAGSFSHADRYTYIPLTGIFIMAAWTLAEWAGDSRARKAVAAALSLAVLAGLGAAAARQTAYWKNDFTLFQHDLAVTGENATARNNLGAALVDQGKWAEAAGQYEMALKCEPDNPDTLYNLGVAMNALKRPAEAERCFREALARKPRLPKAENNLAGLLAEAGKTDEAMAHYRNAIELAPDFADPHNNLGNLLALRGDLDGALEEYRKALDIEPGNVSVRLNVANICLHQGLRAEALAQLNRVLALEPENQVAKRLMGQVYQPFLGPPTR